MSKQGYAQVNWDFVGVKDRRNLSKAGYCNGGLGYKRTYVWKNIVSKSGKVYRVKQYVKYSRAGGRGRENVSVYTDTIDKNIRIHYS